MLITHHPMIFSAIKSVRADDFIGRRILKLAKYDISYYAMHTNFDVMGMADAAADEIDLIEVIIRVAIGKHREWIHNRSLDNY